MTLAIPAVLARGGSSRGLLVRGSDVAHLSRDERIDLFRGFLGSPDPSGRQIDGVGGGNATTSKVAVIAPPTRDDADADYEFYQYLPISGAVDLRGTCGNMSTAAAQFAISHGFVEMQEPLTTVRLHDTNTGQLIVLTVRVSNGEVELDGGAAVEGVPGFGAPIDVTFPEASGRTTGSLFPTGVMEQAIHSTLGDVIVSIVDSVNPVVLVHADSVGLVFDEQQGPAVLEELGRIRRWAAVECGFVKDTSDADVDSAMYPFVGLYWSEAIAVPAGCDVGVRMVSGGTFHAATPLGAALAVASLTVARQPATGANHRDVVIGHPSGTLTVRVDVDRDTDAVRNVTAGVTLTARPIMAGMMLG